MAEREDHAEVGEGSAHDAASRAPLTQYETADLSVAVENSGAGNPMILLHGWPDAPRTWDAILPALHDAGWRTIVPYLRGFGPTTFRPGVRHSGDLEALGADVIGLMDAMGLPSAVVVGHDWGARAAYVAAHIAPERILACVAMSVGWTGYAPAQPLSYEQTRNYWYHWLFSTPRGERVVTDDRQGLTRYLWKIWAPDWPIPDAEFAATAAAFDNPAWAAVTLHSYRVRWGHAAADPDRAGIRAALQADPTIRVPTFVLHGGADPVNGPATSDGREGMFRGPYERLVMAGLGHFPQREDPAGVARAVLAFLAANAAGLASAADAGARPGNQGG